MSNRNISRYLSCRWKNYERYKNTKNTKKKGILSMVHDMPPVSLQGTTLVTCCKSTTKRNVSYSAKFYYVKVILYHHFLSPISVLLLLLTDNSMYHCGHISDCTKRISFSEAVGSTMYCT